MRLYPGNATYLYCPEDGLQKIFLNLKNLKQNEIRDSHVYHSLASTWPAAPASHEAEHVRCNASSITPPAGKLSLGSGQMLISTTRQLGEHVDSLPIVYL